MASDLRHRATTYFGQLQQQICARLEALDGVARFSEHEWSRPGGGGGRTRVLEAGGLLEKGGVNVSEVHGELPVELAQTLPGSGTAFFATGLSLVLHPASPMVPTVHANLRYLERGSAFWFGGGSDLTPYYLYRDDVVHFHATWRDTCERFEPGAYARFKAECDRYFYLPHRGETRGVGGIFFDYLQGDPERLFRFVQELGDAFLSAYVPILERRRGEPFSERERGWQLFRRGRYVEFNLMYDRGTLFGLKTGGRTESILMSLPPLARWGYDIKPEPGSREAELLAALTPQAWVT